MKKQKKDEKEVQSSILLEAKSLCLCVCLFFLYFFLAPNPWWQQDGGSPVKKQKINLEAAVEPKAIYI